MYFYKLKYEDIFYLIFLMGSITRLLRKKSYFCYNKLSIKWLACYKNKMNFSYKDYIFNRNVEDEKLNFYFLSLLIS